MESLLCSSISCCPFCDHFMPLLCDFQSAQRVNSGFISVLWGYNCLPVCYFLFDCSYILCVCFVRKLVCDICFSKEAFQFEHVPSLPCGAFKQTHACKLIVGFRGFILFNCDCIMLWRRNLRHCILWCTKSWCLFSCNLFLFEPYWFPPW